MKIKFGVIGSGSIVKSFLNAAKEINGFEFFAFYSRNEDTAESFKNDYGFAHTYTDIDLMAANDELDAVYIASPNALHKEQALTFLKSGKHVLLEKAFTSNSREAIELIQCAKKNNVVLMEAMRTTVLPNFIQVKNNLHKIGAIRRYFANFCQYSSRYDKYKEGIVLNAFKNELSNGALMDIGVYCIAPMIALFGKPNKITGNAYILESNVDGEGSALFSYDSMDGVIMYSKISNSYLPSEIQGENGSIIIENINNFNKVKIIYKDGSIEDLSVPTKENNIYYEIQEFIHVISTGEKESFLNSLHNTRIIMEVMDDIRSDIRLFYPADYNFNYFE